MPRCGNEPFALLFELWIGRKPRTNGVSQRLGPGGIARLGADRDDQAVASADLLDVGGEATNPRAARREV